MCFKFKKFCCVLDLRMGTLIIACICLAFEGITFIITSFMAKYLTEYARQLRASRNVPGYIYAQKFMVFLCMLLIFFKLLLGTALIIGWVKRLPDHIQMWYKGYLLCIFVQAIVTITAAIEQRTYIYIWGWLLIGGKVVVSLITLYFVMVVRSYYFQMTKETNYYQNLSYNLNDRIQSFEPSNNGSKGKGLFTDKVASNDTSDVLMPTNKQKGEVLATITGQHVLPPQYGSCKIGVGGEVYSQPQQNVATDFVNELEKPQSSMLYPSLV